MRHYYTGPPAKEAILDWAEQAGRSGQIKAPLKDCGVVILKTGGTMPWVEDYQPGQVPYPPPGLNCCEPGDKVRDWEGKILTVGPDGRLTRFPWVRR